MTLLTIIRITRLSDDEIETEAEPVTVDAGDANVTVVLDTGETLIFDRAELLGALSIDAGEAAA